MKYKTLVRLLLKLIGVFMVVIGATSLVEAVAHFGLGILTASGYPMFWSMGSAAGNGLQLLIGLYLFFGGRWVVDHIVPSNRPYCHECAYDLTGSPEEGACPECGTEFRGGRRAP